MFKKFYCIYLCRTSTKRDFLHAFVAGPLWILHFGCADGGCLLGASYSVSLTTNATSVKGVIHLSYTIKESVHNSCSFRCFFVRIHNVKDPADIRKSLLRIKEF